MNDIWMSDNRKWAAKEIKEMHSPSVTFVTVVDTANNKNHRIMVEHVWKGQTIVVGRLATTSYDVFPTNVKIPEYVQDKISELIKADRMSNFQCISIELINK